ncbi:MAG TPA: FtsX-like permease family protein [Anaerolineales bacterium]|nr:FtsX-like permease family protein [Anaerolineales bacterium]
MKNGFVLTQTLLKTGLRDLLRRPLQTGLMILGVALGVAVVIAIDLANTSASRAFSLSTEAVTGRATHQIVGGPEGVSAELYRQVRVDWGFRFSAPVVEGVGIAPDLDGQPLRVLGLDPIADAPFRTYLSNTGEASVVNFARFYTEPNTVLIGVGMAERYGLKLDDRIQLQVGDRVESVTVIGTLRVTPGDEGNRRALDGLLIMDVANAQRLVGMGDRLSRIDLIADEASVERLKSSLPSEVRVVPATEQAETVAQLTSAFQLNLTALSLLALIVGMFLIYNTMMFSVVQRRQVFGIMRSLGVTGGQLFALILFEAALASFIGAAIGLALGWALGQGAVRLVTQTINDLYYVLSVRDAPLTVVTTLKGLALGIGAGLASAAGPAGEAAGVEPITAMRASSFEDRLRRWLKWIGVGGCLLGLMGWAALMLGGDSLIASFGGLFTIVIGLAMVVPSATIFFMAIAARLPFGILNRLAARTVVKAISRTSVAIAALMVAVSVTIGVSLMIDSFRATVTNWLDLTLVADIYLSAPSAGGVRNSSVVAADLPQRVAAVPGVAVVETVRGVGIDSEFGPVHLVVADTQRRRSASLYRFAEGDPEEIWDRMNREEVVIVSEPFAYRHNIPAQGGVVTLRTDKGEKTFAVIGVFYDYASDQGTVMISRQLYEQWWNDRGYTGVSVYAAEGVEVNELADRLRAELKGTALQVQANRALRDEALQIFDRTFAITNALRLLAVIVAFIGVLSALMALQIERTRELSTMQAVGLTQAQLWRLTFLETGFMGATAGVLSLPVGFILALVLVYVINLRSFGWTIQLALDPWVFGQALAVSVVAALLAAIYPLWRLQKMPVAAGLRQE